MIVFHVIGMLILSFYASYRRQYGKKIRWNLKAPQRIHLKMEPWKKVPKIKEIYKDNPEGLYLWKNATKILIIGEILYWVVFIWILIVFHGSYLKVLLIFSFFYFFPMLVIRVLSGGRV